MIYCLCYISKKSSHLNYNDIEEIVSYSQENNTDKQITGVLISYKEHFLQYLEGDSVEIYALFNKIKMIQDMKQYIYFSTHHCQIDCFQIGLWLIRKFQDYQMLLCLNMKKFVLTAYGMWFIKMNSGKVSNP